MKMQDMARIRALDRIKKMMRQFEGQPEDDEPLDSKEVKELLDDEALEPDYDEEKTEDMGDESCSDEELDDFEDEKRNFMQRGSSRGAPGGKNRVVIVEAMKAGPYKKAK